MPWIAKNGERCAFVKADQERCQNRSYAFVEVIGKKPDAAVGRMHAWLCGVHQKFFANRGCSVSLIKKWKVPAGRMTATFKEVAATVRVFYTAHAEHALVGDSLEFDENTEIATIKCECGADLRVTAREIVNHAARAEAGSTVRVVHVDREKGVVVFDAAPLDGGGDAG